MTTNTTNHYKIKSGATFSCAVQLFNNSQYAPIIINDNIEISAVLTNSDDTIFSEINVIHVDQDAHPGFVHLYVNPNKTSTWREGEAFLRIKVKIGEQVIKSETMTIMIERDIL